MNEAKINITVGKAEDADMVPLEDGMFFYSAGDESLYVVTGNCCLIVAGEYESQEDADWTVYNLITRENDTLSHDHKVPRSSVVKKLDIRIEL